jgi:hypothetical protein
MAINRKASSNASTSATIKKGNSKVTKNSSQNFISNNSVQITKQDFIVASEE